MNACLNAGARPTTRVDIMFVRKSKQDKSNPSQALQSRRSGIRLGRIQRRDINPRACLGYDRHPRNRHCTLLLR